MSNLYEQKDADLGIVDAIETKTDGLFLQGWAPKLASAFEPMPLDYYASFLTYVLNESLFPRSLPAFALRNFE